MMKKAQLIAEINSAKSSISEAEKDLARVLKELSALPRADKQEISETVQKAFSRLNETRSDLASLVEAVAKDED